MAIFSEVVPNLDFGFVDGRNILELYTCHVLNHTMTYQVRRSIAGDIYYSHELPI